VALQIGPGCQELYSNTPPLLIERVGRSICADHGLSPSQEQDKRVLELLQFAATFKVPETIDVPSRDVTPPARRKYDE
jgi:hypothetical protein